MQTQGILQRPGQLTRSGLLLLDLLDCPRTHADSDKYTKKPAQLSIAAASSCNAYAGGFEDCKHRASTEGSLLS